MPEEVGVSLYLEVEAREPSIWVVPDGLQNTQGIDTVVTKNFNIANEGTGELLFSIQESADECVSYADLPWVSVTPGSGQVAPGSNMLVTVYFNSSNMPPDTYWGTLCISNNDAFYPEAGVWLEMTVTELATNSDQTDIVITNLVFSPDRRAVVVRWGGRPASSYCLEARTNLVSPESYGWNVVGGLVSWPTNHQIDTNLDVPAKFYRVSVP